MMKFTCDKAALISALQVVGQVLPTKTTKDILKNIRVSCVDGVATFVASDSEITMTHDIDCDIGEEGQALLPQRLMAILKELSTGAVTLEATDKLYINSGFAEFILAIESTEDYPYSPLNEFDPQIVVGGMALKKMIDRTIFACDTESTRYALGGIKIDAEPSTLRLVSTDSRRLSLATASIPLTDKAIPGPVVPSKAMAALARTVTSADVQIEVAESSVSFRYGRTTISSQTVQGRFPDWRRVVPSTFNGTVTMVVGPLSSAIRQAMITAGEDSRTVFLFDTGKLELSSSAASIGSTKVEIPCAYGGEQISLVLDCRYVMQLMKSLDPGDTVDVSLISHDDPVVFSVGDNLQYVQMPIQRDREPTQNA